RLDTYAAPDPDGRGPTYCSAPLESLDVRPAAAIVAAAGRGERMGPGALAPLRPLGGAPILVRAVLALSAAESVRHVVVAAPPDGLGEVRRVLAAESFGVPIHVIAGGPSRVATVALALAQV